jgi:hypothetical protein
MNDKVTSFIRTIYLTKALRSPRRPTFSGFKTKLQGFLSIPCVVARDGLFLFFSVRKLV